jgi:flavin reductase (DIM6/NTAB) family NADH-FMN oxidoreductase RutF
MTYEVADLMQTISVGVYVIGVCDGRRSNAFTASSVMPVSFRPVMVALGVGIDHASLPLLRSGRVFTINVLKRDQMELAGHFGTVSGRDANKLAEIRWRPGLSGAPILVDALAYLECELASLVAAGDHQLALGKVVSGAVLARDEPPLLYRDTRNIDGARDLYPAQLASAVPARALTPNGPRRAYAGDDAQEPV